MKRVLPSMMGSFIQFYIDVFLLKLYLTEKKCSYRYDLAVINMNKAIEESKRYNSEVEYELQAVNTELNNTLQAVLFSGKALRVMKEKMVAKRRELQKEGKNLKKEIEKFKEAEEKNHFWNILVRVVSFAAGIASSLANIATATKPIEGIGKVFQKNYVSRKQCTTMQIFQNLEKFKTFWHCWRF